LGGCAPYEASIESGLAVCRWLAYSGSPVRLEELLYRTDNSLVVQRLHSGMRAEETNGDGFGVGWYGDQETPAVFRSIEPARPIAVHADEAGSA
jgi:predicted glutamine amidotransferase